MAFFLTDEMEDEIQLFLTEQNKIVCEEQLKSEEIPQEFKDLIEKTVECGSPTPFFNPHHGYYSVSFTPCEYGDRVYVHHHLTGVSKKVYDLSTENEDLISHEENYQEASIEFLDDELDLVENNS
jgi:hypothetical protein